MCISINEEVVHGIPGERVLEEGDIVSIDCGVYYKNFHSDSAFTYPVGDVDKEVIELLKVTKESLYKGIEATKFGGRIGDISFAIQNHHTFEDESRTEGEYQNEVPIEVKQKLYESMPSEPLRNVLFRNQGDLKFKEVGEAYTILNDDKLIEIAARDMESLKKMLSSFEDVHKIERFCSNSNSNHSVD